MNLSDVPQFMALTSKYFKRGTAVVVTGDGCAVPRGTEGLVMGSAGNTSLVWVQVGLKYYRIDCRDLREARHYKDEVT